jgi:hypothetical protein
MGSRLCLQETWGITPYESLTGVPALLRKRLGNYPIRVARVERSGLSSLPVCGDPKTPTLSMHMPRVYTVGVHGRTLSLQADGGSTILGMRQSGKDF